MRRRIYASATAFAAGASVAAFTAVAIISPTPRLLWNASASAPLGLYALRPTRNPPSGELVAVRPPRRLAAWLAERHYLPRGVPLLKHVVAIAGQRICRNGAHISIDGRIIGLARDSDSHGRPLPVWHGCTTLRAGELMLMNPAVPDSLDGRYFGPLPASAVLGRAVPILTRDAPGAPLHWRPAAF
jgi:conjugative transfer signal peptidase TraF